MQGSDLKSRFRRFGTKWHPLSDEIERMTIYLERNVDYRVSATQFGGKEPKWVQLIAGDPPYADQRLHPADVTAAISMPWMGGGPRLDGGAQAPQS